ncbi:MAG TPA: alpha/beta fold hydrolase [Kribbella sp.]|nr:alpha/beta fold hydrolase [Kribbella sp.]
MSAKISTNGRSNLPPGLRVARVAFRLLEPLAPGLAARQLDRIWFRLPTVPERARRLRVELPEPTPFEVTFEGRTIRGSTWGEGPTVYLVHGWGGWGLQLAAFVPPLLATGFRVVAYDGPSHGESDPGRDGPGRGTLPELADALLAVTAAQGPAYGVIAHSFGAAAVSQALLHGLSARRVVFLAAATDFRHMLDQFQATFGFGPRTRSRFLRRFTRRFGRTMDTFEVVSVIDEVLEERELPALLAIHDKGDRETPYQGTVALAAAWAGAAFELTEGLGHRRVLWEPAVVAAVRSYLAADRAPDDTGRVGRETMRA